MTAREFVHTTLRNELCKELGDVVVTGHSLGGALGALCAFDIQYHTISSINNELNAIHIKSKLNKKELKSTLHFPSKLHLSLYSYGSPKVGNATWVELYNKAVPDTFRYVLSMLINSNITFYCILYTYN